MRRRTFITLLGGAAATWPLAARAQQPTMPVIGLLDARSPQAISERLSAYRQGLKEAGYIEGENVAIVYRFAENQVDRLPELAGDLVRREVTVIATAGDDVALAAKQATKTIPIVFIASQDPVRLGLVASLARPDGNLAGVNFFSGGELVAKRLQILRELVPRAARVAVLVNPAYAAQSETALSELQPAARSMGLQMKILNADTRQEIDGAFAIMGRERPDALFVSSDTFFTSRLVQLVSLAIRYAIPTAFPNREYAEIGGLMSYGTSISDAWRQSGSYAGRILRVRSRRTCLWHNRLSLNSLSMPRRPVYLDSPYRRRCSPPPTR
jgi:putative tryptophan/tyrosine transport system substrate-binding protein